MNGCYNARHKLFGRSKCIPNHCAANRKNDSGNNYIICSFNKILRDCSRQLFILHHAFYENNIHGKYIEKRRALSWKERNKAK